MRRQPGFPCEFKHADILPYFLFPLALNWWRDGRAASLLGNITTCLMVEKDVKLSGSLVLGFSFSLS